MGSHLKSQMTKKGTTLNQDVVIQGFQTVDIKKEKEVNENNQKNFFFSSSIFNTLHFLLDAIVGEYITRPTEKLHRSRRSDQT